MPKKITVNEFMKMCSVALLIREMKIKIPMEYHYTPIKMVKIKKAKNTKKR